VNDVYEGDAYRTRLQPVLMKSAKVVVDIGAHIGCFAKLCHEANPDAKIICVEACPENIEALRANVGSFAEVVHAACTYEPGPVAMLNALRPNCESTGGSVVVPASALSNSGMEQPGYKYWHDTRELPKVTLEELMRRFGFDRIDLLKLDCEGSEFSILGQTPSIDRISFIMGEYHGRKRWDALRAERFSRWDYGHMFESGELGLFHLRNPAWPAQERPRYTTMTPGVLKVAVPAGIGDSVWTLTKLQDMLRKHDAKKVIVGLCGGPPYRSREFVERFDFVESAFYSNWSCMESNQFTTEGVYNWAPSGRGWHGEFDWMLQANRSLESGQRLENWLPEFETNFAIADHFRFTLAELQNADALVEQLGSYCVFYLGPLAGNTTAGHNRNGLWSTGDWATLARMCRDRGLAIVVVGAEYDRSYFDRCRADGLGECYDAVGQWGIGQTYAAIRRARFVISYQSGVGIFAVYMGVPEAVFWRPFGDSIFDRGFVSFDERMASAWAPLGALESGRYLPLIYTKCSPASIMAHAEQIGWVI
jgi:FkbM family methyltransferase